MPMPDWWRHLNKHFFNPRTLKTDHKWSIISHIGRSSGKHYSTPVEVIPVDGGFATYLMYGRNTDWAKNLLASQSGTIESHGKQYKIHGVSIVRVEDMLAEMEDPGYRPPAILRVREMIRMDASEELAAVSD